MPQLGETVTEGTITKWYKSVGDTVERDEPLFEVSTDKVDSEVPSPSAGVLTAIIVEEGDTVDVGARLAVIGDGAASDAVGTRDVPADQDVPAPAADGGGKADGGSPVGSSDTYGRAPVLSPVVRKLLVQHELDPAGIEGTGLGGRITRADVEEAIDLAASGSVVRPTPVPNIAGRQPAPSTSASASPPAGRDRRQPERQQATVTPLAPAPAERDIVVPFTNIRRRTAEHMVRSKATSAHTLMVKEIDYERVEQVRRTLGERFRAEEGFGLTYLAFAARAAVEALAEFPNLNSSIGDDALIVHRDINLGIAVDLDNEGLIVPVVHNAEELNLRGMARRVRDVADRSRTKRLSLDDISGGTFSITNAGPFGTLITGAIINQPQVAILSTDGVSRKPVVVELPDGTESITIHSVGLVAMSFDHRAVDGAYVARYLARFAGILDERDWAGEL